MWRSVAICVAAVLTVSARDNVRVATLRPAQGRPELRWGREFADLKEDPDLLRPFEEALLKAKAT